MSEHRCVFFLFFFVGCNCALVCIISNVSQLQLIVPVTDDIAHAIPAESSSLEALLGHSDTVSGSIGDTRVVVVGSR